MAGAAKKGAEFLVNTTTVGNQFHASVATLAGGGFVILWEDLAATGTNIRSRIYNAAGAAIASDFIVYDGPDYSQAPAVAALGAGFVATWAAPDSPSPRSVFAGTFNATGAAILPGAEIAPGTVLDRNPQIASSTAGGYLAVWDDVGQTAADGDGKAVLGSISGGATLTFNATTAGNQTTPAVAALLGGSGNYVVTYVSSNPANTQHDLEARIIAANGSPVGGEISIATGFTPDFGSSIGSIAPVAALSNGGFATAYFDAFTIRLSVYGGDGAALASGIPLNVDLVSDGGVTPGVAVLTNRLIAVAWENFNDGRTVMVETIAPDGTQIGPRLTIDSGPFPGGEPAITALAGGDFVVALTGTGGFAGGSGDADGAAIVGQRFSTVDPVFIEGTNAANTFNGVTQSGFFLGYGGFDAVTYASATGNVVAWMTNVAGGNSGAASTDGFGMSIERLIGGAFNDSLVGNGLANSLMGGAGNDFLFSTDFSPDGSLKAGAGNDTMSGEAGDDGLFGGDGNDTLLGGDGNDGMVGGAGNDQMSGGTGNDFLFGGAFSTVSGAMLPNSGADVLNGQQGDDGLYGFDGGDVIAGDLGNDYVEGGDGDDTINGGADSDTLLGQSGSDTINGGTGFDYMYGGGGADTFVFNKGDSGDWILDFNAAEGDKLKFLGFGFANFGAVPLVDLSTPGHPAVQMTITIGGATDQLTIFGATLAQLNATNVLVT